jgi:hypothetical protein
LRSWHGSRKKVVESGVREVYTGSSRQILPGNTRRLVAYGRIVDRDVHRRSRLGVEGQLSIEFGKDQDEDTLKDLGVGMLKVFYRESAQRQLHPA